MSGKKKTEVDYYPEIGEYLSKAIADNLPNPSGFHVASLYGELRKALKKHIEETGIGGSSLRAYADGLADLQTDIAILVLNLSTLQFEILIVEVKLVTVVGLTQLSQLIGYCLVSGAKLGLLVNVNGGASAGLTQKLIRDPNLALIKRLVSHEQITHNFGLMFWNESTQRLNYSGQGQLRNIEDLVLKILELVS